jgi:hypothetical protein
MKRKLYESLLTGTCLILAFSCTKKQDFLDKTQSTTLNEQTVFADSAYTIAFLNGIYSDIAFSSYPNRFGNAGLDACSDESEGPSSGSVNTYIQFATGTVNPSIISNDAWRIPYANIRRVNKFLQHVSGSPLNDSLKKETKGEALFLRAWYYSILLEHYGGVPIIGDTIYGAKDTIPAVRNTYAECVNYIISQCDAAASLLPMTQAGKEYGRADAGACLALKARVLLFAASPLFNGGQIATSEPLKSVTGYPAYSKDRWKLAMDAAQAVMNTNAYSLYVDNSTAPGYGFYEVFLKRKNPEYIFARMQGNNKNLENIWFPPSFGGNSRGAYPYLETVNAFGMKNGLAITDPNSGYDPAHPYQNRDPRLDYSITHDQTLINHYPEFQKIPVNIYVDSTNPGHVLAGPDAARIGTPTGYYTNKMCDDGLAIQWFTYSTPRCFPLMRYAGILLDFAEARNEWLSAPDGDVYAAVEAVRQRAGLDPYQLPAGLTQDSMREVIHHERQVELAFEGQRFWDVRRWKIADKTEDMQMHGTVPVKKGSVVDYETIPVRKHVFTDKMYLWPIPESEVAKSPRLLQNPGY